MLFILYRTTVYISDKCKHTPISNTDYVAIQAVANNEIHPQGSKIARINPLACSSPSTRDWSHIMQCDFPFQGLRSIKGKKYAHKTLCLH